MPSNTSFTIQILDDVLDGRVGLRYLDRTSLCQLAAIATALGAAETRKVVDGVKAVGKEMAALLEAHMLNGQKQGELADVPSRKVLQGIFAWGASVAAPGGFLPEALAQNLTANTRRTLSEYCYWLAVADQSVRGEDGFGWEWVQAIALGRVLWSEIGDRLRRHNISGQMLLVNACDSSAALHRLERLCQKIAEDFWRRTDAQSIFLETIAAEIGRWRSSVNDQGEPRSLFDYLEHAMDGRLDLVPWSVRRDLQNAIEAENTLKRGRGVAFVYLDDSESSGTADALSAGDDDRELLELLEHKATLGGLDARQRQLLRLWVVAEEGEEDLAKVLSCTPRTVRNIKNAIRTRLAAAARCSR